MHALYTNLGMQLPAADYTKSISRVYEDAAIAMIRWSRTLKVLGDVCHKSTSFPSWVPDFSDTDITISTPRGKATDGSRVVNGSTRILNPRPGELCLRGRLVGRVVAWSHHDSISTIFPTRIEQCQLPILTDQIDGLVEDVDTLRLWVDKINFLRQLYYFLQANAEYGNGDAEDTLIDLLNQDSLSEPNLAFNIWLDVLQYPETRYDLTWGETLVMRWKSAGTSKAEQWTPELTNCAVIIAALLSNQVRHNGQLLENTAEILDLLSQFSGNLNDKAVIPVHLELLGRTVIGTGVYSVAEGDSVALLEGADWPIILRRLNTKWQFVGPAFVTGIMDGESWNLGSRPSFRMTQICLV
jgi:hypothetical protein